MFDETAFPLYNPNKDVASHDIIPYEACFLIVVSIDKKLQDRDLSCNFLGKAYFMPFS